MILQTLQWFLNPVDYLEANIKSFPDIFIAKPLPIGDGDTLFVIDPKILEYIFTHDRKEFTAPGNLNAIVFEQFVGNNALVTTEGDIHRQRRQLIMPSFHGERLEAYGILIRRITEDVMKNLPINHPFLATEIMQEISLKVIAQAVFGIIEGERYQKLIALLKKFTEIFASPFTSSLFFFPSLQKDWGNWSPWGKFIRIREEINNLIYAEINYRRDRPNFKHSDVLSLLMSARYEDGQAMTEKELRDELITLLIAGHETTASSMAWALYWLHRTPQVLEKLLAELNTLSSTATSMEVFRLPYLTAVCNETLRICPAAMTTFPRMAQEVVNISGYTIKPRDIIFGCIYLTHHREDIYPNHEQFIPERFLERKYSPFQFIPFGGGSRRCIGEVLAQFEMKLVIATILSQHQLMLKEQKPEKLKRRGFGLSPTRGVKMTVVHQQSV
ncbi:cytochrome P450 [Okeania sp. SIO2B9]|uniref:cytochrome P450 n=1 Tax=Okeania sp. SIO2B9 TaxID=2607782 RepID=UPI00142A4D66|nr:cytochrome P450 [Okeania sp. SIO2B9]NES91490.1 cytochrome P450 [Okeania sp. SIO2B9]